MACPSQKPSTPTSLSEMFFVKFQISSIIFSAVFLTTLYSSRGLCSKDSLYELDSSSTTSSQNETFYLRRVLSETTSSVVGRNDAPHLHHEPKLCANATLFGRAHQGGWFICESLLSEKLPQSNKCIVYSYGLGADW